MAKQYGLILPDKQGKKAAPLFSAAKNVFGDDSDSDNDGAPSRPVVTTAGEKLKRQAVLAQEKVLQEDPTVYQYDELYEGIADQRKQAKTSAQKEEKKPRYIEKLLVAADKRKKDNERRVERQVQKEREEEGDKFADKESFVTSAYKKKLEEMQLEEEKDKREKYLEEIGDVTKQADLGGFYRHLYQQQLQPEKKNPLPVKSEDVKEDVKVKSEKSDSEADEDKEEPEKEPKSKDEKKKRTYRKRTHSEKNKEGEKTDSEDDEVNRQSKEDKTKMHLQSNLDADSDFSIDDSSGSDDDEDGSNDSTEKVKKSKIKKPKKDDKKAADQVESAAIVDDHKFKVPEVKPVEGSKPSDGEKKVEEVVVVKETKPKVDIWKKRTVGEVFDQALQRYYQRKSSRGQ